MLTEGLDENTIQVHQTGSQFNSTLRPPKVHIFYSHFCFSISFGDQTNTYNNNSRRNMDADDDEDSRSPMTFAVLIYPSG